MRLQHRKDTAHNGYVSWLEQRGFLMFDTHNLSEFVDAIGVRREPDKTHVVFFEFKSTKKDTRAKDKARAQKQADLHTKLRRAGAEVFVVRSQDDLAQVEGQ